MKRIWVTGICASVVLSLGISPRRPFYERTDLLSDGALATQRVDSNLVNAWGLASSPSGPFWIANEGTGTSSIALADGSLVAPDVGVPSDRSGHPTGLVFNGTDGFVVEQQALPRRRSSCSSRSRGACSAGALRSIPPTRSSPSTTVRTEPPTSALLSGPSTTSRSSS
jgi:hypothetical protein